MIKSKYLDCGNVQLYYEILKVDPILIYLHGRTANHTIFNHQRKHFHDLGTGSLALDQRGDGNSTHLPNKSSYTLDAYTSDLEKVLEAEGITKSTIIGHSMGTMVAQDYSAKHPEKVDSLVLISASYDFTKSFGRNFLSKLGLKLTPFMRAGLTCYNKLKGLTDSNRDKHYSDFSEERFRTISNSYFTFEMYGKNNLEYVRAMHALSNAVMEWNTELIATRVQAPTLLIHGDSDQDVPVVTSYELHEMIPNSKEPIIIPNSKHGIIFQSPELVNEAIEKFLVGEIYSERLR